MNDRTREAPYVGGRGPMRKADVGRARADGPLVVSLGEDSADEADDRFTVGEDTDDVGAPAEFLVGSLLGVGRCLVRGCETVSRGGVE